MQEAGLSDLDMQMMIGAMPVSEDNLNLASAGERSTNDGVTGAEPTP